MKQFTVRLAGVLFVAITFLLCVSGVFALQASGPLLVLEGEGLRFVVTGSPDEANLVGEIHLGGKIYPFKATTKEVDGIEKLVGEFVADGQAFAFTTHQPEGQEHTIFTTGKRTYKLMPVIGAQPNPLEPAEKPKEANPLDAGNIGVARDEEIRLKRAEFPDITMGNLTAYTMLVPENWTVNGRIEWSMGEVVSLQKIISVVAPDGRKVQFTPQWNFAYTEINPAWIAELDRQGLPHQYKPQQGEAPPQDLGSWWVSYLAQQNGAISNVKLVSQQQDVRMEKTMAEIRRLSNVQKPQGGHEEFATVVISYDLNGVKMREEFSLMYTIFDPFVTEQSRMTRWSLITTLAVAAPDATFDKDKPLLYALGNSLAPTARWWTSSQQMLGDILNGRAKANLDIIRQMGEQAKNKALTSEETSAFQKNSEMSDRVHDRDIDRIYEVQDYKDVDGGSVKLPIHYKRAYSDGKGHYVLTNKTLDRPGEFQEIEVK